MKFPLIAAAALMAASVSAQASVITTSLESVAGATVIDFNLGTFDGLINTTGTINLGQGVTFSGGLDAEISPAARDLGDNGAWTYLLDGFAAAGTNGVLMFDLGGLHSGVSAFVSHYGGESLLVEALGVGGTLLESTTLNFAAVNGMDAYDEGTTIGFQRSSSDILSLRITGVGAVADNVAAVVPEPETYALVFAGLAVVGALARRRTA